MNAGGPGAGVTETAPDRPLLPIAFLAVTVQEYTFPLTRPVTVSGDVVPVIEPFGVPVQVAV